MSVPDRPVRRYSCGVAYMRPILTSRQHPLVKRLAGLQLKKIRKETGLFLIEGPKLLQEAISAGLAPEVILAIPELAGSWADHPAYQPVSLDVMAKIASTDTPPPVLAAAPIIDRPLPANADLIVFLDDLQDPGNLGTILRVAEAAGASQIMLSPGCVDPYNPKVVRGTMGSLFRLPWRQVDDTVAALATLREAGWQIVATTLDAPVRIDRMTWGDRVVLLIGQEGRGLSEACREAATAAVSIPMRAPVESLNAAVATAALLYEVWRHRDYRGAVPSP
ncbi:MAG: RNA methyltransferase [Candidatus Sericytochromatia bacterium]|nr:RNA methyltransferase [Candidatus Sericytochromatia bacterium]